MFTGIVEERGEVVAVEPLADAARLAVRASTVTSDARPGDSVAVDGVCLTVVENRDGTFTADVMQETLDRSTLGGLRVGDRVNLERAATPASRLGGHIVQGHVDGTGTIVERSPAEHWEVVRIALPPQFARYVAEKGSIAVDGVSLTVVHAGETDFTVSLIPTTLEVTGLGAKRVGDSVNLEVDVVAKYLERLMHTAASPSPAAAGPEAS